MLTFEHWGLDPERDKIQFRILGDSRLQAQALAQNVIDGGYLSYLGAGWSARDIESWPT